MRVDSGCGVGDRAIARVLAVEDAQRILVEPRDRVFGQVAAVPLEMRDQCRAPRVARLGVAQCVELERHPVGDAELAEQLVGQAQQFDIGRGFGGAQYLGVDLVELAIAPLLRPLVTEHRARGDQLQGRKLLPPLGDIGARDSRGEFGAQRQRIAALVGEGVHFLRHDIGGLADRAREHLGRLEHRHVDAAEAIQPANALERVEHLGETALLGAENVLRAADAIGGLDTGHDESGSLGEDRAPR